jgi:hypothetical protein
MSRDQMLDDLAHARALAEEGRNAPLVGGAYLILFGVLLAACYVFQWAVLARVLPYGANTIGFVWMGFGAAAIIGVALIGRRIQNLPGAAAIANRVDRAVWHGVAAAIIVTVAGAVARAIVADDFGAPNAIVAAGFGLYGVALYATAAVGGHLWLRNFAIQAWVLSGLMWFYVNETWLYLLAAGGCIAVLIAPGIIMLRRQPAATA